jgi:hypothetical protein
MNGDVYAQRLDSAGNRLWPPLGVALFVTDDSEGAGTRKGVATDGSGGAIVVASRWTRDGMDIYVQRVSAEGDTLWGGEGAPVCTAVGNQTQARLVSDGLGGAFVAWEDERERSTEIYAQRVSDGGYSLWGPDGILIGSGWGHQSHADLVRDGAGGIIVAWTDTELGTWNDVSAQRVSAVGEELWTEGGAAVCSLEQHQDVPYIVGDGAGGAIVAWRDARDYEMDIYAQRMSSTGAALWTQNGVPICLAPTSQSVGGMVGDGTGGAIVIWADSRFSMMDPDIFAQRVDGAGNGVWEQDGVSLFHREGVAPGTSTPSGSSGTAISGTPVPRSRRSRTTRTTRAALQW